MRNLKSSFKRIWFYLFGARTQYTRLDEHIKGYWLKNKK